VKAKTFDIPAGPRGRAVLVAAIRSFAHAAYPPGGSECAQVARESLLTTAATIETSTDPARASRRQRVMLRQAMQWYGEQLEGLAETRRAALTAALLQLLKGETVDESVFDSTDL
jgi:hypothetical protein